MFVMDVYPFFGGNNGREEDCYGVLGLPIL